MRFVDSCDIHLVAGQGGNGCVAFRREKFVPFGGPSGGDGGKGGDIVFVADPGVPTLLDLAYRHTLRAQAGEPGRGKDQYGRGGEDLVVRVPVGTQVVDKATGEVLFDLVTPHERTVVARGGRGGRGNIHFATAIDRAPRRAEPGEPGEERHVRLELKVMADVGLLGFPNVGKSTFIRAVSRARPKVADYPFTTLVPHLGVASIGDDASFVIADIPGLIPGASEGAGLGHQFLRHVERTRALLHLVTLDPSEGREPWEDYAAITSELGKFDPELARRPTIVAMSKADLPEVREAWAALVPKFARRGIDLRLLSAATGEGVREVLVDLFRIVRGEVREAAVSAPPVSAAQGVLESPLENSPTTGSPGDSGEATQRAEQSATPEKKPAPQKQRARKKNPASRKAAVKKSSPAKKKPAPKKNPASRKAAVKKSSPAKKKPAPRKKPVRKVARR
jgi:GTP-binding protein